MLHLSCTTILFTQAFLHAWFKMAILLLSMHVVNYIKCDLFISTFLGIMVRALFYLNSWMACVSILAILYLLIASYIPYKTLPQA